MRQSKDNRVCELTEYSVALLPSRQREPAGLSVCSYCGVNTQIWNMRQVYGLRKGIYNRASYLNLFVQSVWIPVYMYTKGQVWMTNIS